MRCTWKDKICYTKLLQISKSLKLRGVHRSYDIIWHENMAVNRVVYDFRLMTRCREVPRVSLLFKKIK